MNDNQYFRWIESKNGKSYFAIVNLDIKKNSHENVIIENYSGTGFSNHGIDVGAVGMETWKKSLIKGLEFALSHSSDFWTISINALYGKPITDTNPAIVGYTAILAFLEETKMAIDENKLQKIEDFVYESWSNNNSENIPNFTDLVFE